MTKVSSTVHYLRSVLKTEQIKLEGLLGKTRKPKIPLQAVTKSEQTPVNSLVGGLVPTATLTQLSFTSAMQAYVNMRRNYIAPRTFLDYSNYAKTLSLFFVEQLPQAITSDQVREYQVMRMARAGAGLINKEVGLLLQLRRKIGKPLDDVQMLPIAKDYESPGRALEEEEEERLVRVCKEAADHPLWDTAALCMLLSMFSGLCHGEILSLRLRHINVVQGLITVPRAGAKRLKRERTILLNEVAAWALEHLAARAASKCGCADPSHYLVPFRNRDHSFDPLKPAKGWREGQRALLAIADIECRFHDFRHHAGSKAMGDPSVSRQDLKDYFGWEFSSKMFQRYWHGNLKAMKVVAAAIGKRPASPVQKDAKSLKRG